jgi:hypothetical protein
MPQGSIYILLIRGKHYFGLCICDMWVAMYNFNKAIQFVKFELRYFFFYHFGTIHNFCINVRKDGIFAIIIIV